MKRFLLGLLLLIGGRPASGQSPLPVLTKAQMRADFDALTTALTRINPHDFVRRRVNGYAQTDSILALRPALDTVRSTAAFYWLVTKALTYCQDGHTSVLDQRFIPFLDSADLAAFGPADTATVQAYAQLDRRTRAAYRLHLPLKYIDGAYTVLCPFSYRGGSVVVPAGAVLTACNGTDIHAYVRRQLGSLPELHWDFARRRFYADNFAQALSRRPGESLRLTFRMGAKSVTHAFALADTVATAQRLKLKQPRVKRVRYLAGPQVLYIRLPVMRDAAWYLPRIDSIARRWLLRKIVLDVRDNPGGSDPEWQAILTHLVGPPIVQRITSCANSRNPQPARLGGAAPRAPTKTRPSTRRAPTSWYRPGPTRSPWTRIPSGLRVLSTCCKTRIAFPRRARCSRPASFRRSSSTWAIPRAGSRASGPCPGCCSCPIPASCTGPSRAWTSPA